MPSPSNYLIKYIDANFYWPLISHGLLVPEYLLPGIIFSRSYPIPAQIQEEIEDVYGANNPGTIDSFYRYFLLAENQLDTSYTAANSKYREFISSDNATNIFRTTFPGKQHAHTVGRYHHCLEVSQNILMLPDLPISLKSPILFPQPINILGSRVLTTEVLKFGTPINIEGNKTDYYDSQQIWRWSPGPVLNPKKREHFWLIIEYGFKTQFYKRHPWWVEEFDRLFPSDDPKLKDETQIGGFYRAISFHNDYIPDIYLNLFYPSEDLFIKGKYLSIDLLGLTYPLRQARESWLATWTQALVNKVLQKRTFSMGTDSPREFAQKAVKFMSSCIMGVHPSIDNQQQVSSCLNEMVEGKPINYSEIGKENVKRIHRSRFEYTKGFIRNCLKDVDDALGVGAISKIQGAKSREVVSKLRKYAYHSPNGRVLLVGKAGGGKSLAAKEYHRFCIDAIRKNDNDFHRFAHGVWKNLAGMILDTPGLSINTETDQENNHDNHVYSTQLYKFVRRQLRGTGWWHWNTPSKTTDCSKTREPCNELIDFIDYLWEKILNGYNNWESTGQIKYSAIPCAQCKCVSIYLLPRDIRDQVNYYINHNNNDSNHIPVKPLEFINRFREEPSLHRTIALLACYLGRLVGTLFPSKFPEDYPFPKDDPLYNMNFVHINCGMFGGEGSNPEMIMRQLFGLGSSNPLREGTNCSPGLFQIASYMGGTVFLDEIADAATALQDRLLMVLEEKKVFRLGWETLSESVDNIRIVGATHKDLPAAVKRYTETVDTGYPKGFRPDLLSRLATNPPVTVVPIPAYFLYQDGDGNNSREACIKDFSNILRVLLTRELENLKCGMVEEPTQFFREVYEKIDDYLLAEVERFPNLAEDHRMPEKSKKAGLLTMRLINALIENYARAHDEYGSISEEIYAHEGLEDCLANLTVKNRFVTHIYEQAIALQTTIKYYKLTKKQPGDLLQMIRSLCDNVASIADIAIGRYLKKLILEITKDSPQFNQRKDYIVNDWLPDNLRFLMHQP